MGGDHGRETLHSVTGMSQADMRDVAKGLAKEQNMGTPKIAADCNNIAYVYHKANSKTGAVAKLLDKVASCGIEVTPVVDGKVRPICKQATNQRIARKEKSRVKAYQIKTAVRKKKERMIIDEMNYAQRVALQKEIKKMEADCKSKETQARSKLPKNFAEELERELVEMEAHAMNDEYGCVETVVVSEFQADLYMAALVVNGVVVMVMTRDCDIPILAGDCCIAIKSFTKGVYELVSTSEATLKNAMKHLSKESKAKFNQAKLPYFDGVSDPRLRALYMLILGCDVYLPGMKGIKKGKLKNLIDSLNASNELELYNRLFNAFKEKNGLTDELVDTYIDALLYEPTNEAPENVDGENPARTYLFGAPTKLPKYLEQFSVNDDFKKNCIFSGPDMSSCKGVGDRRHAFLSSEGISNCTLCKEVLCTHCQETIGSDKYCLACFATESIVPQSGCPNSKGIADMRQELKEKYNFDGVDDLQSDEVEDAHEMMEYLNDYRDLEEDVKFPLYETAEMERDASAKWEEIVEIHFKEGGIFLAEPDLKAEYIPGVLDLFATLVRFETGKKTEWIKDPAVYESLPALLIKFAYNSRVDSGYRLLMRCVRHAFDSRTPTLEKNSAMLVLHQGDIGIHLNSNIPASMKKNIYQTGIVATAKDILCCKCTCQCGSQQDQRIVCVHNMPLLFLLTLLLFEDLAEHMLLELAACMRGDIWDASVWSDEDIKWMKRSIITLMEAAGEPVGMEASDTVSIRNLLEKFEVGTEKRKKWKQRIRTPPKPSELGPISKMKFASTAKLASCATKRCEDSNEQESTPTPDSVGDSNEPDDTFTPEYLKITRLMDAADCESVEQMNLVGIKLLNERSDAQENSMYTNSPDGGNKRRELTALSKQMEKDWDELLRLQKKRSTRMIETKIDNIPRKESSASTTPKKRRTDTAVITPSLAKSPLYRLGQRLPLKEPRKKVSMRCAKCKNNNVNRPELKFHCVPRYPAESRSANPKKDSVINREGRALLHLEMMDRISGERSICKTKKYICEEHIFEVVPKSREVEYNGETFTQRYKLTVPSGAGPKSSMFLTEEKVNYGLGRDRAVRKIVEEANTMEVEPGIHVEAVEWDQQLEELQSQESDSAKKKVDNLEEQHLVKDAKLEVATSNVVQAMKAVQQIAEETCSDQHIPINSSVEQAAGLKSRKGNADVVKSPNKLFFHSDPTSSKEPRHYAATDSPKVYIGMRDADKEVKRRTGFPSEKALLAYIFIICNGNINIIKQRQTSLTWYEEFFLHFEYIWSRSLTRIIDLQMTYGIYPREITNLLAAKYDIEFLALRSWPIYASYEEDKKLMKEKWRRKYPKSRPVMWDMTNVSAYAFTDADLQRITYSQYYGENCFKGGVFTQLCGWQGAANLWTGAVSDTDYNRREGYLDRQREFQENDLIDDILLPFLNIYDKGYRAKLAAWRNGKQQVLQPDWAESDRRFGRLETVTSASVASDRGGNERSVNASKRAGFISRGFQPNMCPVRFNQAWRTWAFQSNFMFQPVL